MEKNSYVDRCIVIWSWLHFDKNLVCDIRHANVTVLKIQELGQVGQNDLIWHLQYQSK